MKKISSKSAPHTPLPFLGLACAVGVSTIYYSQPLLVAMAHTFNATAGRTGFVAVATQVGYAVGLLLFVPLGDLLERRALMMRMYGAVAVGLLLVAMSPTLAWLIAGSVLIGMLASVTHIVLPIAPDLVSHKERGRAIGIVMTGLLLGILLARTFAGWVSHVHGWRYVFVVAAVLNAAFVPLLHRVMPRLPPKQNLKYSHAIRSFGRCSAPSRCCESPACWERSSSHHSVASGPLSPSSWTDTTAWGQELPEPLASLERRGR